MTLRIQPRYILFCIVLAVLLVPALSLLRTKQSDTEELPSIAKRKVAPILSPTSGSATHRMDPAAGEDIELTMADLCAARERAEKTDSESQSSEDINRQVTAYRKLVGEMQGPLLASTDPEHLIVAAALENEPTNRIELLRKAMEKGIDDPLVLWNAISLCSDRRLKMTCREVSWEIQLLEIDGQNSEVWIRIAANRLLAGDDAGALQAIQQAAVAPESNTYWPESIELIERVLAASSNFSFVDRAGYAFGFASSKLPDYGAYTDMCKKQSADNTEWALACLRYGELLERQGDTILGQAISLSFQKLALESLGDEQRLANVVSRDQTARQTRAASYSDEDALSVAIMASNPSIFFGYLTAMKNDGETGARAHLRSETDRWIAKYKNMECIP